MADAVSSAEASGRRPEGPPGRFRGAVGVLAAASQPGLALVAFQVSRSPGPGGGGLAPQNLDGSLLPSSLPTAHQASWLWPPPIPGCVCRAPLGKAGEEAQRAQNSGCPRSQVFARAVRDRQACGEFGACGTGGSSRVGRQAGGGKLGLPPPPVEPCGDPRSPSPDQKVYPAASFFLQPYSEGSGTVTLAGVW